VLEHGVGFLVENVQLLLVLAQLLLLLENLGARIPSLKLSRARVGLQGLVDGAHGVVRVVFGVDVTVLRLPVVTDDCLSTLLSARLAELLDVAREGLGEHLTVKTRELLEDGLEDELLRQSERLNLGQGHVEELGALRSEDVVITNVAKVDSAHGDQDALLGEVFWTTRLLVLVVKRERLAVRVERVVRDSPLAINDEVDLSDVALLLKNVAILFSRHELTRHESEGDLVDEVGVKFTAQSEEGSESRFVDDVLEQELAHDVLLDLERNGVEVLFLFEKHGCAVVVPEVSKVVLNLNLEGTLDVSATTVRLVADLLDQNKPSLKSVFVVAEVASFDRKHNIDETVHEDGEESDTEDLDDGTHNLLGNTEGMVVTVADRGESSQRVVHTRDQAMLNWKEVSQVGLVAGAT